MELTAKKEFLKMSLVQKGDFIKAQGQDLWVERAALGLCRVTAYILCSLGGSKAKREGGVQRDVDMLMRTPKVPEALLWSS